MSTIQETGMHSPDIETHLFNGHPHPYWVGRLAMAGSADRASIFEAAAKFRGDVYLKLGYVSPEQVDAVGREIDPDDSRSIHFSVIEKNPGSETEKSRIIGTSRLILKDSEEHRLPIEKYFPEILEDYPAEIGSVEVSRLISSHDNPRTQHSVALSLIRAMTHYSINRNIPSDYCMVEEPLIRFLNNSGVPTEILGHPKEIRQLNGVLYPVRIEPGKVIENVLSSDLGRPALKKFFMDGATNQGEGFYDENFLRSA